MTVRAVANPARTVAWAWLLLLLLTGPTPGAVGSCGGDDLDRPADVKNYCTQRDQLVCVRRSLRKELSALETDQCRRAAINRCQSRAWLPECQPTERQARACINALESFSTLQTKESDLKECSTSSLCGISLSQAPVPGAQAGAQAPPDLDEDAGPGDEEP